MNASVTDEKLIYLLTYTWLIRHEHTKRNVIIINIIVIHIPQNSHINHNTKTKLY